MVNALSMPSVKAAEILASRPGWWSGRCPCGCHAGAVLAGYTDADTRAEMSVLLTPEPPLSLKTTWRVPPRKSLACETRR